MKDYTFKYGDKKVTLPLDEQSVISKLTGRQTPPIADVKAAVYGCLSNPIDHPPLEEWLSPGEKIAMVISDMTRFWMRQDLVIPHIIRYLNELCGIGDEDIVIVVATGTHLGGDEQELRTLVTNDIFDRIEVRNHDCLAEDLVYIGNTTQGTRLSIEKHVAARKTICVGACTQHVMAGFGGGRKSILPGVASMEAIKQNHALSLDPLAPRSNPLIGNGVLEQNPLNEDMCEAAKMVEHLFMVNLVMNADMVLAHLFAGHWQSSWQKGCEAAAAIYEVAIDELADVVITSSGGFPKDMSLYQGSKTIDNVEGALKPGGTLIALIECRDGGGPAEYFDWLEPLTQGRLDEALRRDFTIPGYIFYLNCEQASRYQILLLSSINPADTAPMGIKAYDKIEELLASVDLAGKRIYVIPNGSTVIPKLRADVHNS